MVPKVSRVHLEVTMVIKRMLVPMVRLIIQCVGKRNSFIFKNWEIKPIRRRKLRRRRCLKVLKKILLDQIISELQQNLVRDLLGMSMWLRS